MRPMKGNKVLRVVIAMFLTLSLAVSTAAPLVAWADNPPNNDPVEDPGDNHEPASGGGDSSSSDEAAGVSFPAITSAATNYLDTLVYYNSNINNVAFSGDTLTPAYAGEMLGFVDFNLLSNSPKVDKSQLWSLEAKNSAVFSYEGLSRAGEDGSQTFTNSLQGYAYYGAILTQLGLAETGATADGTTSYRMVTGFLLQGSYWLASSLNNILGVIINGLQTLNPFQLFLVDVDDAGDSLRARTKSIMENGIGTIAGQSEEKADIKDDDPLGTKSTLWNKDATAEVDWGTAHSDRPGLLGDSDIGALVADIYKSLMTIGNTFAIPLFVCVCVAGIVFYSMWGKGSRSSTGSRIKHMAVRVLFILLGIPLLGYSYTFALGAMAAGFEDNSQPERVVAQTLVDFDGWVSGSNLAVNWMQSGSVVTAIATWNEGTLVSVTPKSTDQVRRYALNINKHNKSLAKTATAAERESDTNLNLFAGEDTGKYGSKSSSYYVVNNSITWDKSGIADLIKRYTEGVRTQSSAYEAHAISSMKLPAGVESTAAYLEQMTAKLDDSTSYGDGTGSSDPIMSELLLGKAEGLPGNLSWFRPLSGNKGLQVTEGTVWAQGDSGAYSFTYRGRGLTPVSMYNFLNTVFAPTSMTVYSGAASVNEASRPSYYSVTQAGNGLYGTLLMANSIAMMLATVIIGLSYGLTLLFNSLKNSISLIAASGLAIFGSLQGIARVIGLVLLMIAELVFTVLLYQLVTEFLFSLNNAILGFLTSMFTDDAMNSLFAPVSCILGLAFLIMFVMMALRLRKSFVSAVSDGITNVVRKLTDTDPKMPQNDGGSGALMSSAMGALRTGKMMGLGGDGSIGAALSPLGVAGGMVGAGAIADMATGGQIGNAIGSVLGSIGDAIGPAAAYADEAEGAAANANIGEGAQTIGSSRDMGASQDFAKSDGKEAGSVDSRSGMESSRIATGVEKAFTKDGETPGVIANQAFSDRMASHSVEGSAAGAVIAQGDMVQGGASHADISSVAGSAEFADMSSAASASFAGDMSSDNALSDASFAESNMANASLQANNTNNESMVSAYGGAQAVNVDGNMAAVDARASQVHAQGANVAHMSAQNSTSNAASSLSAVNVDHSDAVSAMGGAQSANLTEANSFEDVRSVQAPTFAESHLAQGANAVQVGAVAGTQGVAGVQGANGAASLSETIRQSVPLRGVDGQAGAQGASATQGQGGRTIERTRDFASAPESLSERAKAVSPLSQGATLSGARANVQGATTPGSSPLSSAMAARGIGAGDISSSRDAHSSFAERVQVHENAGAGTAAASQHKPSAANAFEARVAALQGGGEPGAVSLSSTIDSSRAAKEGVESTVKKPDISRYRSFKGHGIEGERHK